MKIMPIQKDRLEAQTLQLPTTDRVALVRRLIESLDASEAGDFETEWAEEAEKRYAEYRHGLIQSRSGEDVIRDAKARLK